MYVGPSPTVLGAVRVAVITNGKVQLITTTAIKCISDGGDIDPYQHVDKVLRKDLSSTIQHSENSVVIENDAVIEIPEHTLPEENPNTMEPLHHADDNPNQIEADQDVDDNSDPIPPPEDINTDAVVATTDSELRGDEVDELVNTSPKTKKKSTFKDQEVNKKVMNKVLMKKSNAFKDEEEFENNRKKWGSRADRYARRIQTAADLRQAFVSLEAPTTNKKLKNDEEYALFLDWSNHEDKNYYYNFASNMILFIQDVEENGEDLVFLTTENIPEEFSGRAVTENVPRSFQQALRDPIWGEAARKEFETVTTVSGCMVQVHPEVAKAQIAAGAQVIRMLAVYEEKEKEGSLVRKVRLVADGRMHKTTVITYSATPSREELLILLHIFSSNDWDYYHIDEIRAFM